MTTQPPRPPTSVLKEKEERRVQKQLERLRLKEREAELHKEIEIERTIQGTIASKHTMALARRHMLLQDLGSWEEDEKKFTSFHSADLHMQYPKMLSEKGKLGFLEHEDWPTNPHCVKGRSSRRTGTYHDVTGTLHFGPNENDEKRKFYRKHGGATESSSAAVAMMPLSAPAKDWLEDQETRKHNAEALGHGVSTLPNLKCLKHRSSRRTKWYTDYEGKRIMVDNCDLPEHYRCFR
eukprot:PhF_6_TR20628/c0_g1_i2/m.29724